MDAQGNYSPTAQLRARIIFLTACCGLLTGCATVDLPAIGGQGFKLEDDERRLYNRAREAVESLDNSGVIYEDQQLESYLTQVARELLPEGLPIAETRNLDIRVKVINDPDINAFSLPNGRIYVHTGMLAVMENEAELAAIISHELAHVLNRHVLMEKRSTENKATFFNVAFGGVFPLAYQMGTMSSVSGFSKQLELEADEQGFGLLAHNGYDVRAGATIFGKIKTAIEEEQIKVPFFFSTHPDVVTRLNNYQKLAEAHPFGGVAKTNEADFQRVTGRMFFDTLRLWLQNGRFKTADRYIHKYLDRHPGSAEGFYMKGELYRQRQDPPKGVREREKSGDYHEAISAYEKAIENDPGFSLAYQGKGRILKSMKKDVEAREAFEKYLELNPGSPDRAYIEAYLNN